MSVPSFFKQDKQDLPEVNGNKLDDAPVKDVFKEVSQKVVSFKKSLDSAINLRNFTEFFRNMEALKVEARKFKMAYDLYLDYLDKINPAFKNFRKASSDAYESQIVFDHTIQKSRFDNYIKLQDQKAEQLKEQKLSETIETTSSIAPCA